MISLIIPFYNNEADIEKLMNNLTNLKSKSNGEFEIIFVDDCGNHETKKLIDENKFNDYKMIKHDKNLGLGGARNTGVAHATYDWVMFLDADDALYETSIDLLVKKINENPKIDAIEYGYKEVYAEYEIEFNEKKERISKEFIKIPSWTKLINKNKFIPFENHVKHEDLDNFLQYTVEKILILHLNEVLYLYNKENENSITTTNWTKDLGYIVKKNKNKNKRTNSILANSLLYYAKSRKEYKFSLLTFIKTPTLIPAAFNEFIYKYKCYKKKYKIYFVLPSKNKRIYLMGTPIHGNVGDHAITMGEIAILESFYDIRDIKIIEGINNLIIGKRFISSKDMIFIQGGGNVGDLYPSEMKYRTDIIKKFPNNKKIIFTASIYFKEQANKELQLNELFNDNNITFLSRESKTYDMVNEYENVKNFLLPDVVNLLMQKQSTKNNNSVLLLKREDIEKVINTNILIDKIEENIGQRELIIDDTIKYAIFDLKEGKIEVEKILKKIKNSDLVITDRLHGMILSYISNTPVIVLPGNIKIEESYNLWYSDAPKVHFLNDVDDLNSILIEKMSRMEHDNECIFTSDMLSNVMESINEE